MPISNIVIPRILNKIRMLNTHSEEDIDMMRYALQAILWEIEKLLILGIIFAICRRFDYFLVTLVVLMSIRINAGGYHSNSSFGCLLWTFIMFTLSIIVLPQIELNSIASYSILVVSFFMTLCLAPIYHVQREHLLKHKTKRSKVMACIITFFWIVMLLIFKHHTYTASVLWIIFLQNMQLLYEYLRRKKVKRID